MKTVRCFILFTLAVALIDNTVGKLFGAAVSAEETNLWVTPQTPPPIEAGKGLTVRCPDPLSADTKLDNQNESFHIYLPAGFDPKATYGVVVFITGPSDHIGCPVAWMPVINEHKLIYIAPQNAGNKQMVGRRDNLAVVSARLIQKYYHTDPKRIYVAGYSGGARVAGMVALNHPDLFRGTIQSCGADFYQPVPRVAVTEAESKKGEYGGCSPGRSQEAKANVRFVFVTGPGDFRYHFCLLYTSPSPRD